MKTSFIISTIFIILCSKVYSEERCSIYKCTDLPPQQCGSKTEIDAKVTYNLKECSDDNKKICPFKSLTSKNPTATCVGDSILPTYAGGFCTSNSDCIEGATCEGDSEKKCKVNKASCDSHNDCEIGKACIKDGQTNICKDQLNDDAKCTESYECKNGSACFKIDATNSQCKKLFSIESGQSAADVTFPDSISNTLISFCKSGFKDENGICRELTLTKLSAEKACNNDDDCVYEYTASSNNVQTVAQTKLPGSCECSYSSGVKQCKLANSSKSLVDYISILKIDILENNQGICHTKERFNCKKVASSKTLLADYQTKQVNSIFEHKFKNADACVKSVLFPYFIVPGAKKCPKFKCNSQAGDNCGFSTGKITDIRNVTLNPCKDKFRCHYDTKNFFNENSDTTEPCELITVVRNSLPGEYCESDNDCSEVIIFNKDGELKLKSCDVTSHMCLGAKENERCKTNESCLSGLYCQIDDDPFKNKCVKQIDNETTECKSTFDCKNNFICLNKKCKEPFSVSQGESVDALDEQTMKFACSTGYFGPSKRCAQLFYSDEDKVKAVKGLVKCNFEDKCHYKIVYKPGKEGQPEEKDFKTEDCQCGFNSDGQGYCPYAIHDADNVKRFQNINKNIKSSLNNNSHTVKRFEEYTDSKKDPYCKNYWTNPSFRNSVSCAQEVLRYGTCDDVDKTDTSTTPSSDDTDSTQSNTKIISLSNALLMLIGIAALF